MRFWMLNSRLRTALQHESVPQGLRNKGQGRIERCGPFLLGQLIDLIHKIACKKQTS